MIKQLENWLFIKTQEEDKDKNEHSINVKNTIVILSVPKCRLPD